MIIINSHAVVVGAAGAFGRVPADVLLDHFDAAGLAM